jgi:hypothetical protein
MPDVPVVLLSGRISVPKKALVFVDAYLGPGTTLDDLLEKLRDAGTSRSSYRGNSAITNFLVRLHVS